MCFNNYGCRREECVRTRIVYIPGPPGPRGPQGIQGAQGLQGATGPQGLPGMTDALYAGVNNATVATNAIIPIAELSASPTTTMSVSDNAVNLPAGTYLVTYGVSGSTVTAGNIAVALYENGAAIPNERVQTFSGITTLASATKTVVVNMPTDGTLSLYNVTDRTLTVDNAFLTAVRTA